MRTILTEPSRTSARPERVPGLVLKEIRPGVFQCGENFRLDTARGVNDYCPYDAVHYLSGRIERL